MSNLGIELNELIDLLSTGHEAIFSLCDKKYIIQLELNEVNGDDIVLYQFEPEIKYLCRISVTESFVDYQENRNYFEMYKPFVEKLLNEKCLNGKSFIELKSKIHVDEIF